MNNFSKTTTLLIHLIVFITSNHSHASESRSEDKNSIKQQKIRFNKSAIFENEFVDSAECRSNEDQLMNQFFADYASKFNFCKKSSDCVEYRNVPVNVEVIQSLENCELTWAEDLRRCNQFRGPVHPIEYGLQLPNGYFQPDDFKCEANICVPIPYKGQSAKVISSNLHYNSEKERKSSEKWKKRVDSFKLNNKKNKTISQTDQQCVDKVKLFQAQIKPAKQVRNKYNKNKPK